MSIKPIEIIIRAKDEFSGMLGSMQTKVAAAAVAIAGFFSVTLFAGSVKSAGEFEAALSRVKAATDATVEEMTALKQAAEDAGASTKYTSVQAAEALENLAKAGLNAKDAVAALPAVLALAQAGDVQLGQSAEFVTKAVMGMGLAFSDAGRVADVLAMGANASNTSVKGLAEALSYAAPVAHSLGLSLETTVAIIGKFADAGIDASRAGTALNSVLSQFSDPASKFRESLNAIGITTGNFELALRQLAEAGPRGASAILAVGQEAGPALRALLNQGIGALDELKGKLEDSAGSAARTAAIMEDNLPGAMNSLASAWDTVKNVLGAPVLPVLKDAVNQFAAAMRGLVSDGTIAKFGESIAEAFRSGTKWGKDFIAQIDFKALTASMQDFAARSGEAFAKIGEYASTAGNSVKLAYGVMSGGANAIMTGIYGIAAAWAEAAVRIVDFGARASDALSKIAIGKAKTELQQQAAEMREVLIGLSGVRDAFLEKMGAALQDTADAAQMARDGFVGLASGTSAAAAASAKADADIKAMAASIEAAGKAAETSGPKQSKAATDAAAALAQQRAKVAELRAEYEKQMALGNLQGAAEILQKIDQAQKAVASSAELSSKQIEALAAAMAAKNTVAQAGLNLELAQERAYEATARAAGNEFAVLNSKIRQKEIEIKIVQATVKAMNDEADASIRVAEAKMAEARASKDGLSPELEADLRNRIELSKAKKLEAQAAEAGIETLRAEITMLRNGTDARDKHNDATRRSAQARDLATAALERENAAQERAISAQEKANQLKERELELYREKWNIDKEGFSLNTAGQRFEATNATRASVYNQAKGAGLDERRALEIADSFEQQYNRPAGLNGIVGGVNPSDVNKAINDAILAAAREKVRQVEEEGKKTQSAGSGTNAGASAGVTYVNNITMPGVGTLNTRHQDNRSAMDEQDFIRKLQMAKGASQ